MLCVLCFKVTLAFKACHAWVGKSVEHKNREPLGFLRDTLPALVELKANCPSETHQSDMLSQQLSKIQTHPYTHTNTCTQAFTHTHDYTGKETRFKCTGLSPCAENKITLPVNFNATCGRTSRRCIRASYSCIFQRSISHCRKWQAPDAESMHLEVSADNHSNNYASMCSGSHGHAVYDGETGRVVSRGRPAQKFDNMHNTVTRIQHKQMQHGCTKCVMRW